MDIMRRRSLYLLQAFLLFSVQQAFAEWTPWWYYFRNPNMLYYENPWNHNQRYNIETISTDWDTEMLNGKIYTVYEVTLWERTDDMINPPGILRNMMHMRKDGQRILVIYDEYKKMMVERGYKSDDFDSQCRYELTGEGEMVLYDFGMQVGDKFRSVPGKEDIYVVERYKEYPNFRTRQDTLDIIKLSNGFRLVYGVGFKGTMDVYDNVPNGYSPQGNYFDYLSSTTGGYGMRLYFARCNNMFYWEDCFDGGGSAGIDAPWCPKKQGQTYDLNGHRLTEKPSQPGIYIQDGRKYVVK